METSDCIFCKIVNKEIPAKIIAENENVLGFMDINPLSEGHCLFIPKQHAEKFHDLSPNAVDGLLELMNKVAKAAGFTDYNILQNNGKIAHQEIFHVHFHLIPKYSTGEGLGIIWKPNNKLNQTDIANKILKNLSK